MKLDHDEYAEASAQRELAEELSEQGIDITRRDGAVVLRGHVESDERRDAVAAHVARHFPGCTMQNDITVVRAKPPADAEEMT